jgi:hypothetical protein
VTWIGYLPQVTTCGYENQALRAAKMHKIILEWKYQAFIKQEAHSVITL